ncbi:MAG: SpoVA/SpoVAEb family sporulation membrane protein [Clostridiales bacterium]|nr:SpoVA/SpoVAEb family sporulation membrane protein [Clostridiales bacterium]
MNTEQQKKIYQQYIKEVTPSHNIWMNMLKAFFVGGLICLIGQILMHWFLSMNMSKEEAGSWVSVCLIGASILLTSFHLFGSIAKFGGAGVLVPITGFANSVAAPAIEYKKEGQVFGIGVNIFTISGPVILYGIFSSWVLGILYYVLQMTGIMGGM